MKLVQLLLRARTLRDDVRGQDLIEYAMLAGFVIVAGVAMFPNFVTPQLSAIFSKVLSGLNYSAN